MRYSATFVILAALTAAGGGNAAGQDAPAGSASRIAIMPMVGINWMGTRFEEQPRADTALPPLRGELGPTNGPHVGVGLEIRATPAVAVTASAAFSRLSYRFRSGTEQEPNLATGIAGSQDLLRLTAGAQVRVRANVPGYFAAGAIANLVHPRNPVWAPEEKDRVEVGGYAGVGIDFKSKSRTIRLDARLMAASPSTDPVRGGLGAGGGTYEPRSLVYDLVLSLGLLFDL